MPSPEPLRRALAEADTIQQLYKVLEQNVSFCSSMASNTGIRKIGIDNAIPRVGVLLLKDLDVSSRAILFVHSQG